MNLNYNKSDVLRQIGFLENRIDLNTFPPLLLSDELWKYFPYIPSGILDIPKGARFYRGRIHEGGPSFKKVSDFSYVPHECKAKCTEFGRANLPMQSLFYSSDSLDAAQMECITKDTVNSIWFISFGEWTAQENLVVADIILHDSEEIKKTKNAGRREHVHSIIQKDLDAEQFECIKLILDFFGKQFAKTDIKTDKDYLFSVYLASRLLQLEDNGKKVDGLQYPSIPMLYSGNNIVFNPEVTDNKKLLLTKTYEIVCGLGSGNQLQSRIENTSVRIENDEVFWAHEGVVFGSR